MGVLRDRDGNCSSKNKVGLRRDPPQFVILSFVSLKRLRRFPRKGKKRCVITFLSRKLGSSHARETSLSMWVIFYFFLRLKQVLNGDVYIFKKTRQVAPDFKYGMYDFLPTNIIVF